MRLLLIDDDDMVRDVLRAVLTEAGHDVLGAVNGVEGLKALEGGDVDIVVTDILMPEMEGVETIFEMRKNHPNLGIIAISGGGRTHNLHPLSIADKVGADLTLPKPIEPERLLEAVEQVAARRASPSAGEAEVRT